MISKVAEVLIGRLLLSPVFVVGTGRSGTSVLLRGLSLHPEILPALGEAPFLRDVGELVNTLEFSVASDYYMKNLNVSKRYLRRHLRRLCFEYVHGPYYGLGGEEGAWRGGRKLAGARRWCAKTFPEESGYRGLRQLYPNSKFVYIIRNGIEVVHSRTRFEGFRHLDFDAQCRAWADSIGYFGYLNDAEAAISVHHENLVGDPESLFRAIFDFIGVGFDEAPVQFVSKNLMHPLDEATKTNVEVQQAFEMRQPVYRDWTLEQRAIFKEIAGDAMRVAGYEIPF
jgi:hypothetical protein